MYRRGDRCAVCGQPVEVEQIEVTTWADGPNNPQYIDGRASCPSGCDPNSNTLIDFSRDRVVEAVNEAIRHNARILERHRTEEDPFYWNDSMRWTAEQQEAS
jgi:hypothetical protein